MILASNFRNLRRRLDDNKQTLALAIGTGMNAALIPLDTITLGRLSEAGKIPINVFGLPSPDYPAVANQYLGLKRLATRIAELIGCPDKYELKDYTPLLNDDLSSSVAELFAHEAQGEGVDSTRRMEQRAAQRHCLEVGLRRAGQFIVDLAILVRSFERVDRVVVPGNLSLEPQVQYVWEGIRQRAACYAATVTPLASDLLAFDLAIPEELSTGELRTQEAFESELESVLKRFQLVDSQTLDFLPSIAGYGLLNRVVGDKELVVTTGSVTTKIPIPEWFVASDRWQTLAANTAHAIVTTGCILGHNSDFDEPGKIFERVLNATGSHVLAHRFNNVFVMHGLWILQLYRTTFIERSGGHAHGITLNLNECLVRALGNHTQPDILGIDIGRSKVRAALFHWEAAARSWTLAGKPEELVVPKGIEIAGIVDSIKKLTEPLVTEPQVIGVSWPGCITQHGDIGGYSGLLGDASSTKRPNGVTTTTVEYLRSTDLRAELQRAYPMARIQTMNDMTAWSLGLWTTSSNGISDAETEKITDPLLAPLGAAMLAWLIPQ